VFVRPNFEGANITEYATAAQATVTCRDQFSIRVYEGTASCLRSHAIPVEQRIACARPAHQYIEDDKLPRLPGNPFGEADQCFDTTKSKTDPSAYVPAACAVADDIVKYVRPGKDSCNKMVPAFSMQMPGVTGEQGLATVSGSGSLSAAERLLRSVKCPAGFKLEQDGAKAVYCKKS
jgi:hypothetical protein